MGGNRDVLELWAGINAWDDQDLVTQGRIDAGAPVRFAMFSPDGQLVVVVFDGEHGTIQIWSASALTRKTTV